MLKFLTHKLRTHSLNEDPNQEKSDDDHDSGTESDDELQVGIEEPSSFMEGMESPGPPDSAVPSDSDLGAPCPVGFRPCFASRDKVDERVNGDCFTGAVLAQAQSLDQLRHQQRPQPKQSNQPSRNGGTGNGQSRRANLLLLLNYNDQHSSEEELEVINRPRTPASHLYRPVTVPEKRKWSQVSCESNHGWSPSLQSQLQIHRSQTLTEIGDAIFSAPNSITGREFVGWGSSDEEVQSLLKNSMSQPVQFCTSPPVDACKPGRSLSPPQKLFHALMEEPRTSRPRSRPRPHPLINYLNADTDALSACSPRKRHRPPHEDVPRPCLDFEKMRHSKAKAMNEETSTDETKNETSVPC
ncbi:uncharacterized protein LOC124299848 isoform X1 [Neodiprion virginianus]|uniref:uncharacterized protein LOC124299848 isoform X1 n=1 Tax=Neodiprion virginianus TaxID=2961670 RepID=UPI001EE744DE|nr:uncharacterized protein LOC124299848 isoform X1 [Neodiprion virginianus]XP_046609195.1 uncharacterized protein LOC124299848 isoform X1 [Neodiprion virginianus]XP_046609197.1 uncharacterized protein LOC124299848 isoform X1 [Neodiprion virginianus]XP_046609198.1 uncharacterized protein LOC124299848 isoform X1 [Neodiprion virginianus]XP_046609199.1 uncharacterized protein LOC124299848 isoform X1 [Neodiprion virginianus]